MDSYTAANSDRIEQTGGTNPSEAHEPPDGGRPRSRHRRRLVLLTAIVIVLSASIVGVGFWWLEARHYESTDDAFIDVHVIRIAPQVAGRVSRVLVDDNARVDANEVLVAIDPAIFKARFDDATAAVDAARDNLDQANAQRTVTEADAEQARADVGVAEANSINAGKQLERDSVLVRRDFVSRQQLDNDTASERSAAANLVAARKKLIAADAQIKVAATAIEAARSRLESAQAMLEQARLNLSYTRIVAPEAGHVVHLNVAPGDYVDVGANVMALVPLHVWVTANFKETQLSRIRPGEPVSVAVDAYPGIAFHGHVASIQPGSGAAFSLLPPENATGNYIKVVQRVPVKIVLDDPPDPDRPLGPGMSVVPTVRVQ